MVSQLMPFRHRYAPEVVTLRRVSQLIVLAEELNFHRAADRLHVSQPALSRSIRKLEAEVGARLVIRTTRSVRLTEVGRLLVTNAGPILTELDSVIEEALDVARAHRSRLRVGFKAGATGRILTPTLKAFEARYPEVEIELRRLAWAEQAEALLSDRVDVAFVWLPAEIAGLAVRVLTSERRCVAVAHDHRLAELTEVSLANLADEPVVTSRSVPADIARWWAAIPRPGGTTPPLGPSVDSVEEMLEVVARGRALCFVAESFEAFYGRPDIRFIPVIDLQSAPVAIAWRADESRPVVSAFREVAMATASHVDLTPSATAVTPT